jgi:hypothetical protein
MIVFLLLSSFLSDIIILHPVVASGEGVTGERIGMITTEDITVLDNGTIQIAITMMTNSTRLAEMYREMLGVAFAVAVDEEMPIPEYRTEKISSEDNSTDVLVPVRDEFHKSIAKEQLLSLGLKTEILESRIVPRTEGNECKIMINAIGQFEVFNITETVSNDIWEVSIGPSNVTGITGFTLSRLIFTQLMLGSIQGEQAYENRWRARFILPNDATLLNSEDFVGKNWLMDFGGGSFLRASVQIDEDSAIVVDEETFVTKSNFTTTPEYLSECLSNYKSFQVRYEVPCPFGENLRGSDSVGINCNWNTTLTTGWVPLPTIALSKTLGDEATGKTLNIKMSITPKFRITEEIGWQFRWVFAWPPIETEWFKAVTTFESSLNIRFEATASYAKTWLWHVYQRSLIRLWFDYGVPVWINIKLSVDTELDLSAEASFIFETTINTTLKAGVRWDKGIGWSQVNEFPPYDPVVGELAWHAHLGATVTPAARFRFEFLFYDVAGPFVEFEPYAIISAGASFPDNTVNLDLSIKFNINVGVVFDGWIRKILEMANAPAELVDGNSTTIFTWDLYDAHFIWALNETLGPALPVHDLCVAAIQVPSEVISIGDLVNINVTIRNNGNFTETSDIRLFQNDSIVGSLLAVPIDKAEDASMLFEWDTRDLAPGNYVLRTEVEPVADEMNLEDNRMNITVCVVAQNDLGLVNLIVDQNEVTAGQKVRIAVTIKNFKGLTEDANVTVYCNQTFLQTQLVKELAPDEENILTFSWDTATFASNASWVVWANMTTLHYDENVANNALMTDSAIVKIIAQYDLNSDGLTDINDIVLVASAFGSTPEKPQWKQIADINGDGIIDIFDLILIVIHFS